MSLGTSTLLPALGVGVGVGLRPAHYGEVLADPAALGDSWVEVISENFFGAGGNPRRVLHQVRAARPVVLHGVSLSIGAIDPLDRTYLARLRALVDEIDPAAVSDHLCWSSHGGHSGHDLWPLPYTEEALAHVVRRVGVVQDLLRRPILLENPSAYVRFAAGTIGEAEFLAEVARRSGCGILLDVNNVYVTSRNLGGDPDAYIAALPAAAIGYLHLAGHDDQGTHLLDTHDRPVAEAVWALYRRTITRLGPRPTLIEWDDEVPSLAVLLAERDRARREAGHA